MLADAWRPPSLSEGTAMLADACRPPSQPPSTTLNLPLIARSVLTRSFSRRYQLGGCGGRHSCGVVRRVLMHPAESCLVITKHDALAIAGLCKTFSQITSRGQEKKRYSLIVLYILVFLGDKEWELVG